jgi:endonuclease/exonuclease/phosphatase (EEP) superfamily protein YafD
LRRWAGLAGAALALVAAGAAGIGLIGAVWGWPDALNHFAPVWLCAAWIGGLLARFLLPPGKARARIVIAAALTVLVSGAPVMIEAARGASDQAPGPPGLTVMTFNRWWDSPESPRETAAIRASGADLVALQEADNFADAAAAGLKDIYPHQLFCDGCDTAVLSKRPFLATGRGRGDFLWARTTAPDGRPVTLATVHLFWPIPPWIQRRQRARLAANVAALPQDELVLTGDFNLTPWSFAMRSLDRSLKPLTRRTHGLMTFPATWPVPVLALDQVFAGPQWRSAIIRRLPRAGSDHYPLLVQLRR